MGVPGFWRTPRFRSPRPPPCAAIDHAGETIRPLEDSSPGVPDHREWVRGHRLQCWRAAPPRMVPQPQDESGGHGAGRYASGARPRTGGTRGRARAAMARGRRPRSNLLGVSGPNQAAHPIDGLGNSIGGMVTALVARSMALSRKMPCRFLGSVWHAWPLSFSLRRAADQAIRTLPGRGDPKTL